MCVYGTEGCAIYIGIDDTDSENGMCTTYLVIEILRSLSDYDLIGYPRLVRLNPTVPWKTRGNGAIALHIGHGRGKKVLVAEVNKKKFYAWEKGDIPQIDDKTVEDLRRIVSRNAMLGAKGTHPAIVVTNKKPPQWLYWRTLRDIVKKEDVESILCQQHARVVMFKSGRGIIGAAAAISWRPKDRTYEILVYRERRMWGKNREIDLASVIKMDKHFPTTFNNYDYKNKYVAIMPNSPCPVLFGIRGDDPNDLREAKDMVSVRENIGGWVLFLTNQATDEHLQRLPLNRIRPYTSVVTSGVVSNKPVSTEGGHVFFNIENGETEVCVAAYEPTKEFRHVVLALEMGDEVEVYGSVVKHQGRGLTINLEKLRIKKVVKVLEKVANPICTVCEKRMKSIGHGKGYRCRGCGAKVENDKALFAPKKRGIGVGIYEVPVCARRHLSKPLKRQAIFH